MIPVNLLIYEGLVMVYGEELTKLYFHPVRLVKYNTKGV